MVSASTGFFAEVFVLLYPSSISRHCTRGFQMCVPIFAPEDQAGKMAYAHVNRKVEP